MRIVDTIRAWVVPAAAAFALVALGLLFLDLRRAAVELEQTAIAATSLVQESHARVVGTSQNLNAILIQAGLASDEVRRASVEQRRYWRQLGAESVGLLRDARGAVVGIQTTEADIDRAAVRVSDSAVEALAPVPATLEAMQQTLGEGSRTLRASSLVLEDPSLVETERNVAQATATVAHTAGTFDVFVSRVTRPANFAKQVLMKLLGIGPSVAIAATK